MADGYVITGGQGNFPLARADAFWIRATANRTNDQERKLLLDSVRAFGDTLFKAPWIEPDPFQLPPLPFEEPAGPDQDVLSPWMLWGDYPPGVMPRNGSSPLWPTQVPDLIGVEDRRYLDHTGLARHRNVGDLMRYIALHQGMDLLGRYGAFVPGGARFLDRPEPRTLGRYSDEQLYALSLYLYSLKAPPNPLAKDERIPAGRLVFEREGCGGCHTPPLYTNNRLSPVEGFEPPADHARKYDLAEIVTDTDPNLALKTRKGTGYYKVPSLNGVWYRGPFEHSGSVLTLEDWFDPARLRDNYRPTGFKGIGRLVPVKGHNYGLGLVPEDRAALIAFLKSL
jgi:hypothetical protein